MAPAIDSSSLERILIVNAFEQRLEFEYQGAIYAVRDIESFEAVCRAGMVSQQSGRPRKDLRSLRRAQALDWKSKTGKGRDLESIDQSSSLGEEDPGRAARRSMTTLQRVWEACKNTPDIVAGPDALTGITAQADHIEANNAVHPHICPLPMLTPESTPQRPCKGSFLEKTGSAPTNNWRRRNLVRPLDETCDLKKDCPEKRDAEHGSHASTPLALKRPRCFN